MKIFDDIFISPTTAKDHDYIQLLRKIDEDQDESWKAEKLKVQESNGGYANRNLIVSSCDDGRRRFFIRLFNPMLKFYLRNNKRNYAFYNDQGLSAPIHCLFGNGSVMDVLPGTPITLETAQILYEADVQKAVAEEVARYHRDCVLEAARRAGFQTGIGWHEPEWFRRLFKDDHQREPGLPSADTVLEEMAGLDARLNERGSPLAFCHGDLNPSNIIYNYETKKAVFVDYDSPSVTHAVFDIALFFYLFHEPFNAYRPSPSDEYKRQWLRFYLAKKNELNGVNTSVSEEEIKRYMADLKIAHLKVTLHVLSCFSSLGAELKKPDEPVDPAWVIKLVSEHWSYYKQHKQHL